jgi:hypothetical protein
MGQEFAVEDVVEFVLGPDHAGEETVEPGGADLLGHDEIVFEKDVAL